MADKLTPEEVRAIRDGLKLSRRLFAQRLQVSVETVRSWEKGRRPCQGAMALHVRNLGQWAGS